MPPLKRGGLWADIRRGLWATIALLFAAVPVAALPLPGWQRFDIPKTGSYFQRYLPASADPTAPLPLIVFLHGSGSFPESYQDYVRYAAETARAVLVLPKSASDLGWGFGTDAETVAESLRLAREELPVDDRRIAIAGHSAGGAYAYLLAYTTISKYSAVFTLAAPRYNVSAVADPAYKAPIRMYYGTTDPNYMGGGEAALKAQWDRLGITWEEDIQAGFGHNTWPLESMTDGFLFLVRKTYVAASPPPPPGCVPGPTTLCLQGGRFRAEVTWRDDQGGQGGSGHGQVVACADAGAGGSGLFWFFSPENWELMVKVIDGCAVNQRWWVFSAATTDVGYDLTVTDTQTGQVARYTNPLGRTSPAITDIAAFATCP
jgi:predicted esterase